MREWLLGIVLTAFAGGLARQLAPRGREQAMVRLVSGLLLALALLAPLAELTGAAWEGEALEAAAFRQRTREQEALYRKNQQEVLAAIIAENRLGLACEVRVTTAAGESGIPLPDTVTIRGPYSAALALCVEEEVGVPAEKTIWLEEEAWTETKESGG